MINYSLKNKKIASFITKGVQKLIWVIGNNAFLFIVIFIVVDIIIGEFLFYHYIVSVQSKNVITGESFIHFQSDAYQSVRKDWQNRDILFNKAGTTIYNDPFQ